MSSYQPACATHRYLSATNRTLRSYQLPRLLQVYRSAVMVYSQPSRVTVGQPSSDQRQPGSVSNMSKPQGVRLAVQGPQRPLLPYWARA